MDLKLTIKNIPQELWNSLSEDNLHLRSVSKSLDERVPFTPDFEVEFKEEDAVGLERSIIGFFITQTYYHMKKKFLNHTDEIRKSKLN